MRKALRNFWEAIKLYVRIFGIMFVTAMTICGTIECYNAAKLQGFYK